MSQRSMIPFNKPLILGDEISNIKIAFENGNISGSAEGIFVSQCEEWLQKQSPGSQAYLTKSCTAALEFAATLAGIQRGDEVIMPSYTYVSTMSAFTLRGATCVFVDISPEALNIDPALIEAAITPNTKAIVPVHYSSLSCDMDAIMKVANQHNLLVIEDAACTLGSEYKGRSQGSIGHIGCLSFHGTKPFTAGGQGGAILVNDPSLFHLAEQVFENGTDRRAFARKEVASYTAQVQGGNFQMSEVDAAALWAQMTRSNDVITKRNHLWNAYSHHLQPLADSGTIQLPKLPQGTTRHNGAQFWILCGDAAERKRLIAWMRQDAIEPTFHYQPLHKTPFGYRNGRFNGKDRWTSNIADRVLRLPIYYQMTDEDLDRVVNRVQEFYNKGQL